MEVNRLNLQQPKGHHQSSSIVEVFQKLFLPAVPVFHLEVRRLVEQEPGQCRYSIHDNEQVVHTSPTNGCAENECIADGRCKPRKWNSPKEDVALCKEAPFHRNDFRYHDCMLF